MKNYEEAKKEMRPEEVRLNDLLKEYKQVSDEMNEACKLLDIQIENLTDDRNNIAWPYQEKLANIEAMIRLPMMDYQHTFISSYGKINYRKGAVCRSWNLDALDQIAYADEYIKDKMWPFRTETIGEPSITVKLADMEV